VKGFASDNYAAAHPAVLAAIAEANEGHAAAYGADPWTARAEELLREHFGEQAQSLLVFNGSAANVLCLRALCRPWESVICAAQAHINVDEGGAPERIAGVKLQAVPTPDAKLTPEHVASQLGRRGDEHAVQPRVVSVTQSTELGTRYSPDELSALAGFAHEHGLLLHVDGARLANAAVALDVSLRAITTDAGVDAVSFGGTKNGLLLGEAVVFCDPAHAEGAAYLRKQTLRSSSRCSRAISGGATPRTPTRWPPGWRRRCSMCRASG
jgi:threonine aldolase